MQNVEFICELAHAVEHQHVVGDYIAHIGVETQRLRNASHEIRARHGITAGKQGHVMAQSHKLIGDIGDNSLGTTIQPGWHALHERRNLRNFHVIPLQRDQLCAQRSAMRKVPRTGRPKFGSDASRFGIGHRR